MTTRKILFVDDEPSIRQTLPTILGMHGYEVTVAASVSEALIAMQAQRFDVLLTDLNIGQPGDGFTVVSAMRRTQPDAVTLILTGFPAFETALEAIRSQVDDYLVKPANVEHLVTTIERRLEQHTPTTHIQPRRLSSLLREHEGEICSRWLEQAKEVHLQHGLSDDDRERTDVVPALVRELARILDHPHTELAAHERHAAMQHGRSRRLQGAPLTLLSEEVRVLRAVLFRMIQENLLAVNVSYVFSELALISDHLDAQLSASIHGYLSEEELAA